MEKSAKKTNVCLVTWYNSLNYGTCLQSYALLKILNDFNYNAFIPQTLKFFYYDFFDHPILSIKSFINIINNSFFNNKQSNNIEKCYTKRQQKINDFVEKHHNIYPINSYKDYKKMQDDSDIYLTGSDQIWNPYIIKEAFLLTFVKNKKRKVAYGSSLGVSKIPTKKKKLYKRALSDFYRIGVREKSSQQELSSLLNKKIENVIDPTYLLPREHWSQFCTRNSFNSNKYILCYFIGKNTNWVEDVKKFATKNSIPIHVITSEAKLVPNIDNIHADLGVEEFLSAINNASYIITDSFHAIAFSVIFHKKFAVYKRFSDTDNMSQNSRVYDILKLFNIKDRLISSYADLKILHEDIDYEQIDTILKKNQQSSLTFLKEALI